MEKHHPGALAIHTESQKRLCSLPHSHCTSKNLFYDDTMIKGLNKDADHICDHNSKPAPQNKTKKWETTKTSHSRRELIILRQSWRTDLLAAV